MKDTVRHHFQSVDPILFALSEKVGPLELKRSQTYFLDLVDNIISQQLSEKAGTTIFKRFESLFSDGRVTPEKILKLDNDTLRSVGISHSKVNYIKNLALHVLERHIVLENLSSLSDGDIIEELTKLKGIGPWTAEMFLIFSLGRENVFSNGDLGLRRAIQSAYGMSDEPSMSELDRIIQKWSPYKSWASLILWKSLALPKTVS